MASSATENADDPMVMECVIRFNIYDLGANKGIFMRCSFTPNDLNIGLEFHDFEHVVVQLLATNYKDKPKRIYSSTHSYME